MLNFGLKSFFKMTTLFAWIIFAMQFALLMAEYGNSSLSNFPKWLTGDAGELLVVALTFTALLFVDRIFKAINIFIIRIYAKRSKKNAQERAEFIFTEDYHTPYPLNFIWIVLSTVVTVTLFFAISPYAGWGSDPELTQFFVPGDILAYLVTILALYRIFTQSWDDVSIKSIFIKNFANETPADLSLLNTEDLLKKIKDKKDEENESEQNIDKK